MGYSLTTPSASGISFFSRKGRVLTHIKAQQEVYVEALRDSKISAEDVSYIEVHGSATVVGKSS